MGYNSIPDRWEEYSNVGKLIPGTQIIPFKVPLREEICRNLKNSRLKFTLNDLVAELGDKKLSMIIDLTQTKRYYSEKDLETFHIKHIKFATRGGGFIPTDYEVKKFCNIIENHLKDNPEAFIGVHCTHGLNRTGYFICRYMIDSLGFPGSTSVELFEESRGHRFDRENYREFLINKTLKKSEDHEQLECRTETPEKPWRNNYSQPSNEYNSRYEMNMNEIYDNKRNYVPPVDNFSNNRHYNRSQRTSFNSNMNDSISNQRFKESESYNDYKSYRLSKERKFSNGNRNNNSYSFVEDDDYTDDRYHNSRNRSRRDESFGSNKMQYRKSNDYRRHEKSRSRSNSRSGNK